MRLSYIYQTLCDFLRGVFLNSNPHACGDCQRYPATVRCDKKLHVFWAETQVQRLNLTVEILVNAAGVCRVGRVENCADEDLNAQLQLNVVGTSRLTRLFAKGT